MFSLRRRRLTTHRQVLASLGAAAAFAPFEQAAFRVIKGAASSGACDYTARNGGMSLSRGVMTPACRMTYCSPPCYPVFQRIFCTILLVCSLTLRTVPFNPFDRWIVERVILDSFLCARAYYAPPGRSERLTSWLLVYPRRACIVAARICVCGSFLQTRTTTRAVWPAVHSQPVE